MAEKSDLSPEIERYAERWAKDPDSRIFAQLADAYRKEGLFDEAIQICLQGIRKHPRYVSGRVVLARTYMDQRNLAAAEGEFLAVLDLSPDNLVAHKCLSQISLEMGRVDEATARCEKAITLHPLDRELKEFLATIQSAPVSTPGTLAPPPVPEAEPLAVLSASQEIDPTLRPPQPTREKIPMDVLATETLADLYVQQGLSDKAADIYRRLLEEDPSRESLLQKLQALPVASGSSPAVPVSASPAEWTSPPPSPDVVSETRGDSRPDPGGREGVLHRYLSVVHRLQRERTATR